MKLLHRLRKKLWLWWFLKVRLPRLIERSSKELRREYRQYCQAEWDEGRPALSFADWCGMKVGEAP